MAFHALKPCVPSGLRRTSSLHSGQASMSKSSLLIAIHSSLCSGTQPELVLCSGNEPSNVLVMFCYDELSLQYMSLTDSTVARTIAFYNAPVTVFFSIFHSTCSRRYMPPFSLFHMKLQGGRSSLQAFWEIRLFIFNHLQSFCLKFCCFRPPVAVVGLGWLLAPTKCAIFNLHSDRAQGVHSISQKRPA
jgi:hypothetical protein